MKTLALCVITRNHPERIEEQISKMVMTLGCFGIDLYFYDGSDNNNTREIVEKYCKKGYLNLFYYGINDNLWDDENEWPNGSARFNAIMKGTGLMKSYDYIWLNKDSVFVDEESITNILCALEDEPDVICIEPLREDNFDNQAWLDYDDCTKFYRDYMQWATELGRTIIKRDSILAGFTGLHHKQLLGAHFEYLFERLAEMEKPRMRVICNGVRIDYIRNASSGWINIMFDIWVNDWAEYNVHYLPEIYNPYKESVMKYLNHRTLVFAGGVNRLIELRNMGILTPEVYERVKENWHYVSDIPTDIFRDIAYDCYDKDHDSRRISCEGTMSQLLLCMIQLAREGKMTKEQLDYKNIAKGVFYELEFQKKYDQFHIQYVVGSIKDILKLIAGNDVSQEQLANFLQMILSMLILAEKTE